MKNLRKEVFFTQKELAELAGISRSAISLGEKGYRTMPANVVLLLGQIKSIRQQSSGRKIFTANRPLKFEQTQKQKLEKQLKGHIEKASLDAVRLSQTLEKMQERYRYLFEKLNLLQILKENSGPETKRMALLEWMELDTIDKMKNCSAIKQTNLRYKLMLSDAKKQAATEIKNGLDKIS